MKKIFFEAVPFDKGEVTLALESGVDAVIAEAEHLEAVRALSKIPVLDAGELEFVALKDKSDEEETVRLLAQGRTVILREGWEIIPVENILAQSGGEIISTRTRHAMAIHLKTAVMNDGRIIAEQMTMIANAGAYSAGTSSVVWVSGGKFFKKHKMPNLRFIGYLVFTNTPVSGVMRGFGSLQ